MKRNELEVGKEYAYVTGNEGKYSLWGEKVVVVSTEPHEYNKYRGIIRQVPSGATVLVSATYYMGGEPKQMNKVVQLRHIVEEWTPYAERVEQTKAERAEMDKKNAARQDYKKNIVMPKVDKLVAMLKTNTNATISEYTAIKEMDESVIDHLIEVIKFYEDYRDHMSEVIKFYEDYR